MITAGMDRQRAPRAATALALILAGSSSGCLSTPEHGGSVTTRFEDIDSSARYRMDFTGYTYNRGAYIAIEQRQTNGLMQQVGVGTASTTPVPETVPPIYPWTVNANTRRGASGSSFRMNPYNPLQPWPFGGVGTFRALQYPTPFSPAQLLGSPIIDVQTGEIMPNEQNVSAVADVRIAQLGAFIDPELERFRDPELALPQQTPNTFLSRRLSPAGAGNRYRTVRHTTIPSSLLELNNNYQKPEDPITAAYFNDGDLGFGRRMECWLRFTNNVANWDFVCGVGNYVDADEPVEGAVNAQHALERSGEDYVATVAMIWSSYPARSSRERQVRFAVYNPFGEYSPTAALDAGGQKEVPGLCINCHGGSFTGDDSNSDGVPDNDDVRGSMFLPFDVASFKFPSSTGLTPALEESFRALNYWVGVIAAIDGRQPVVDLVNGWYNHDGGTIITPGQTFSPAYTPFGWSTPRQAQLYHQVVAPYCRTCHIALDGFDGSINLTWNTAFEFVLNPVFKFVCNPDQGAGRMPHAQRTYQNFWANGSSAFMTVDYPDIGGFVDASLGSNCVYKQLP